MQQSRRWMLVTLIVAGLQLAACTQASAPKTSKIEPAQLESIAGSDLKRLVLTEKAAERIGLQTAPVRDAQVTRTRVVGGQVVDGSNVPNLQGTLVRVLLNLSDATRIDRAQPVLIQPLTGGQLIAGSPSSQNGRLANGLTARAIEVPPPADAKPGTESLFYVVDGAGPGLAPGQSLAVELTLSADGMPRQIVPYSAVLYDLNGQTWVYTNPSPLSFVRHRISLDYIDGDLAVLREGPPAGTQVVTVGAAELFGTEFKVGK